MSEATFTGISQLKVYMAAIYDSREGWHGRSGMLQAMQAHRESLKMRFIEYKDVDPIQ